MNNIDTPQPNYVREILPNVSAAVKTILDKQYAHLYDDMIQSTCLKCLEKLDKYDPSKGGFFSWVFQVTRFHVIDELRKADKRKTLDLNIELFNTAENNENDLLVRIRQMKEALKDLPEQQRQVVILKTVFNYSGAEISEIAGIPASQVTVHYKRAKRFLRSRLTA